MDVKIASVKWRSFSLGHNLMKFISGEWCIVNAVKGWVSWHLLGTQMHYCDVIVGPLASQITSLTIVYSTVYSDANQRKLQSSASLAFVRGIHRGPVNSPHKWPYTRKMFPFDDVIMVSKRAVGTLFSADDTNNICLPWVTKISRANIVSCD